MHAEFGAGGIIFRRRAGRLEFFFVKHGEHGKWTLPKGHQELGESLVQTAIREIREEVGLKNLRYIASVGKTSFRFRRANQLIEKTVQFFLFEATSDAKEILTGEEAIWEAIWVTVDKLFETSGYRNLDRLLARSLRLIAEEKRNRK